MSAEGAMRVARACGSRQQKVCGWEWRAAASSLAGHERVRLLFLLPQACSTCSACLWPLVSVAALASYCPAGQPNAPPILPGCYRPVSEGWV